MKTHRSNSLSFSGKTRIALVMMGIIPFLLIIYIFTYERINISDIIVLFAALALCSILAAFSLLRKSSDHLVRFSQKTAHVLTKEKGEPIQIGGDQELNDIAEDFNSLLAKLNESRMGIREQSVQLMLYARDISQSYKKAKEEIELRNRLSCYVGENLVKKLMQSKDDMFLESERKEITILFADIRSFTSIAENMDAEEVVSMLNQLFNVMVDIVFKYNGVLDKFVGDQLMAIFGLVPSTNSHSFDAISAAIKMQEAAERLKRERIREGKEGFEIGIGINTGNAIVGNVGSHNRINYTAIGDSVNIASRLQQVAKSGKIIVGKETYYQTKGCFRAEEKGDVRVKNRMEPLEYYSILR